MKNTLVLKATDWVTELGGNNAFMWLMYGCASCMMYPVRSSDWYRVTRNVKTDEPGTTFEGKETGYWHCAACFDRWGWRKSGNTRLIVIGEADEDGGFIGEYELAYTGKPSQKLDNKIQFLKTAQVLTHIDGRDIKITKGILLELSLIHI